MRYIFIFIFIWLVNIRSETWFINYFYIYEISYYIYEYRECYLGVILKYEKLQRMIMLGIVIQYWDNQLSNIYLMFNDIDIVFVKMVIIVLLVIKLNVMCNM